MESQRTYSLWREFQFMYHQIERAILPNLSLQNTIQDWSEIRNLLAEGQRKRINQIAIAFIHNKSQNCKTQLNSI